MYITKIDGNYNYKNKPYFLAKIPEKELIQELTEIAASKSDIVKKHISYLNDMQKGSNISPERKAEINEWLSRKLYEASSFNPVKEEQQVKEYIEYIEEERTPNKLIRNGKKVLQFLKEKIKDEPEYVHPMMRSFNDRKHELSFFEKFRDVFSSYLELIPKSVQEKAKTSKEKPLELEDILKQIGLEKYGLDMSKQSDNIETKGVSIMDSINLSTNKTSVPSQGVTQNSQPQPSIKTNELKKDTFEREDKTKMSTGEKVAIAGGVTIAGAAAITYIATRGKNKKAGEKVIEESKEIVETGKKAIKEIVKAQAAPEKENIPKKFLELENKYMEYSHKSHNKIPYDEKEYDRWRAEVYDPFMKRIKDENLSTVEKKVFSSNPNEQVKEKEEYLRSILLRAYDNEASFYDAMTEFEKYGRKDSLFEGYTTNITYFKVNFPQNPSEKTVNKFMDICEEFGEGLTRDEYGAVNSTDGLNFMTVISKKGVITSIDQLKRALEKGKKIIWCNDSIDDLVSTLMRADDAPYKNNKEVKEILQKFYDTAYENRKPFMEDFARTYYDYKNKCWHYSYEQERVKHIIL